MARRIRCPHCQRTFRAPTHQQVRAGQARSKSLDPMRRRAIAQLAARARWAKIPEPRDT